MIERFPVPILFLIFIFLIFIAGTPQFAISQPAGSIEGIVLDAESNEPLPSANVYLVYTTLGTSTDTLGQFNISNVPDGTFDLAVSMLGYASKTVQVNVQDDKGVAGLIFQLEPIVYELQDVEVTDRKSRSWDRNYKRFEELLLGDSRFAKSTEITNPYVLDFERTPGDRSLRAWASEPLIIENRALGYTITYELQQFEWDPHEKRFTQVGLPRFKPMEAPDEKTAQRWQENRESAWKGSLPHLFRSMIYGRTFEEGFQLTLKTITNTRPVEEQEILFEAPTPNTYKLLLEGLLDVEATVASGSGFLRRKHRKYHYQIEATVPAVIVDRDGFTSPPMALQTRGYPKRLAELLPREYGLQRSEGGEIQQSPKSFNSQFELVPLHRTYFIRFENLAGNGVDTSRSTINDIVALLEKEQWKEAAGSLDELLIENQDHMEARYYRAISYREIAKFLPYLNEAYVKKTTEDDWKRASSDFEWIISQNEKYGDVLYQYAILKRYQQKYKQAIELSHRQLQLRPSLQHVNSGLFHIYEAFVYDNTRKARKWLSTRKTDISRYFLSETHRLNGEYEKAIDILMDLIDGPVSTPVQPLYLSLAQNYYQLGQEKEAESFVYKAITSIRSKRDSDLVLAPFVYILEPGEWTTYQALDAPHAYRSFFETFWEKRNPLPSLPWNERMAEHFRRLSYAEEHFIYNERRIWSTNPDFSRYLKIPETYTLNDVFSDKGIVYIRHGEPADRVIQVGPYTSQNRLVISSDGTANFNLNLPDDMIPFRTSLNDSTAVEGSGSVGFRQQGYKPNESWRYIDPDLDFHFTTEGGGNWHLVPVFPMTESAIEARAHWGGYYSDLASEAMITARNNPLARPMIFAQRKIEDASREFVSDGLSSERHTWNEDVQGFDFPYLVSTFRGENSATRIDISYALPLGLLSEYADPESSEVHVEQGCILQTRELNELDRGLTVQSVNENRDLSASIIGSCQFSAPPDSYRISLHSRPANSLLIGGYSFDTDFPDYSTPELLISDILPAEWISSSTFPSRFNKGNRYVRPNPFARYSIQSPVFVYFEIYNLTLDEYDQTQYTLEYELIQSKRLLGLFNRKDKAVLSLKTSHQGSDPSPVEVAEIDVQSVEPGTYQLVVKVTDDQTGITVESTRHIELVD